MEKRYHALDACRSVMMLLGVVLHSTMTYNQWVYDAAHLPLDDPNHFKWHFIDKVYSGYLDILGLFIHVFRMPVFFILAGFFAALIIHKRGLDTFLKNRIFRIVLPFLVGWAVIIPFDFWTAVLANDIAGKDYLGRYPWPGYIKTIWNNTGAFWFLYFLAIYCVFSWATLKTVARFNWFKKINVWFTLINTRPILRFIIFSFLTTGLMLHSTLPFLPDEQSFLPHVAMLVFYCLCFAIGWNWYNNQEILEELRKNAWYYFGFGCVGFYLFFTQFVEFVQTFDRNTFHIANTLHSLTLWALTFAGIGVFLRVADQVSRIWRYMADSSYFVYMIHVSTFVFIQGLLYHLEIPAIPKALLCLLLTMATATLAYHLLCRHSIIGIFLNGKRYHWNTSEIAARSRI